MYGRKILMLKNLEFTAGRLMLEGQENVDIAIHFLGKLIDRSSCKDTIQTCEKLIEVLNDGPELRKINQLSSEQAEYAAKLLSAVYDCVTLSV